MVMAAVVGGSAVLGAGASIVSGNKAAKATKDAAASSNALQADIYNQNKTTLAPFVGQGAGATGAINSLLGINGADPNAQAKAFDAFRASDGYQFRLDQGAKSVQAALGANGYLDSGAAQKSLLNYGQGAASDEFGKYYANLTGQQGVGLTAAAAQAGVGTGYANAVSANNTAAGNAAGNAALNTGNSVNGALGSALSSYALSKGLGSSYGSSGGFGPGFLDD